jgi:hypothetical protein
MANLNRTIGWGVYITLSVFAFIAATLVTDVIARMSFSKVSLFGAVGDHFRYAGIILSVMMIIPFVAISAICALLEKSTKPKISFVIYVISTGCLIYFYAKGFWAAQEALQQERWTASSLSVGILPFIGFGVVLVAIGLAAIASKLNCAEREG